MEITILSAILYMGSKADLSPIIAFLHFFGLNYILNLVYIHLMVQHVMNHNYRFG